MTRDNSPVTIRALKPDDRAEFLSALRQCSSQSLYRRLFSPKQRFTEKEIAYFLNVDFRNHVALIATLEEGGRDVIAGGARFIMTQPERAELAFLIIDRYQGRGIGLALMRHLVILARSAGIKELFAEVLAENRFMLNLFQNSGCSFKKRHEDGIVHVTLGLSARGDDPSVERPGLSSGA
jgi:GNAT superfamily N-acetyltransferase